MKILFCQISKCLMSVSVSVSVSVRACVCMYVCMYVCVYVYVRVTVSEPCALSHGHRAAEYFSGRDAPSCAVRHIQIRSVRLDISWRGRRVLVHVWKGSGGGVLYRIICGWVGVMCVCAYICVFMCACVCAHVCMYVHLWMCTYECIYCVCVYICVFMCACVCAHVCMYVHVWMCTYECIYIYIYSCVVGSTG